MKFELEKTLRGADDSELLSDLKRCAEHLGRNTITIDEYREHGLAHPSTIQRRFGSWTNALSLASLDPSRSPIGISDDDLFGNLKDVWTKLGRQPRYGDIKKPLSRFSAGTYEKRFGGWRKSLEQFISWINSDDASKPVGSATPKAVIESKPTRRTRREISERQRFRILLRDGFRCLTCGASPLKGPGIELHVDHVLPWSKGGETVDENLRTKCSRCNLGKGNAYDA